MNKSIDEYMKLPYKREIVEDPYEGGFVVSFPELPGCITTAETYEEAWVQSEDAKYSWLEAAIEDGFDIAEPEICNYNDSSIFNLPIPESLFHRLSEKATNKGISTNQYCIEILTVNG